MLSHATQLRGAARHLKQRASPAARKHTPTQRGGGGKKGHSGRRAEREEESRGSKLIFLALRQEEQVTDVCYHHRHSKKYTSVLNDKAVCVVVTGK